VRLYLLSHLDERMATPRALIQPQSVPAAAVVNTRCVASDEEGK
jgi:hypothetical protein